ncbi:AraC family transcriptional regulator [Mycolicibacterium sp. P1-5]|uniref:AraC family transcriptional regulator n=1 Tax=Mycolicibacterium sp. P1-5 TaxID=2024617 RepID=UPI0011EE3E53|nr:AraC family transcriptional regulator [Mycolicibacterium sp. P1-5]KAA0112023.1 AraC family transcriptional regulator [Mycolicibacterium sp. P1-5]
MRDRPEVAGDPLSTVLRLVEARGAVSGALAAAGAWTTSAEIAEPLKFTAVVRGEVRVQPDGVAPMHATAGDVLILNHRRRVTLSNVPDGAVPVAFELSATEPLVRIGRGDRDVILGGHIDVNEVGRQLLRTALPPALHVRATAADAPALHGLTARIYTEMNADRIGSDFAVAQLAQLLVLAVLRMHLDRSGSVPPGLLRLLTDEQLRPAAAAMHADPGRPWQLPELARIAAMSRTSFAERFRAAAGVPPMTYLSSWRIRLAQRALRDGDMTVGALAYELGYGAESAFSNAFKRAVGMSPLHYRRAARARPDQSSSSSARTSSGMSALV